MMWVVAGLAFLLGASVALNVLQGHRTRRLLRLVRSYGIVEPASIDLLTEPEIQVLEAGLRKAGKASAKFIDIALREARRQDVSHERELDKGLELELTKLIEPIVGRLVKRVRAVQGGAGTRTTAVSKPRRPRYTARHT
jgi:hypothetical protein